MTSAITTASININFPKPGVDNDSTQFRTNFREITLALGTAKLEIETLQTNSVSLVGISHITNNTNSVSTLTGALIIDGGVGIGGDVYTYGVINVSSGTVIAANTPHPDTSTSDVTWTGTYGEPTLNLSDSILSGNKFISGKLKIGENAGDSSVLYVGTTATSQTGIYVKSRYDNGTALSLETHTVAGLQFTGFIDFFTNPSGSPVSKGRFTTDGTSIIFGNGNLKIGSDGKLLLKSSTPASATATGVAGEVTYDASYIYICTDTDTWKRVAIATWP